MPEKDKTQAQLEEKIRQVLKEVVTPRLAEHGGGIDFKSFDNGTVEIYFRGACAGCPGAIQTLEELVAVELSQAIPEVQEVVIAQDISEDMLAMARKILQKDKER